MKLKKGHTVKCPSRKRKRKKIIKVFACHRIRTFLSVWNLKENKYSGESCFF